MLHILRKNYLLKHENGIFCFTQGMWHTLLNTGCNKANICGWTINYVLYVMCYVLKWRCLGTLVASRLAIYPKSLFSAAPFLPAWQFDYWTRVRSYTFKSSYNRFKIDIHQQLQPLTANYLVMFKVISTTIYT